MPCCQVYSQVASGVDCMLHLTTSNGQVLALDLSQAVVYPIHNAGGAFRIQTPDGGANVAAASGFDIDDIKALINDCQMGADGATAGTDFTPAIATTTTTGNTTDSLQKVSITNVGVAAGTVMTISIPVGVTVTYEAYLDPVPGEYKRVNTFAYDATGTTFLIASTP